MDDLISRQAAIDEIARWIGYIDEDMILRIQTGLKKVPSAQRTGRWVAIEGRLKCSACGFGGKIVPFNFCPNCGCAMEGEEE